MDLNLTLLLTEKGIEDGKNYFFNKDDLLVNSQAFKADESGDDYCFEVLLDDDKNSNFRSLSVYEKLSQSYEPDATRFLFPKIIKDTTKEEMIIALNKEKENLEIMQENFFKIIEDTDRFSQQQIENLDSLIFKNAFNFKTSCSYIIYGAVEILKLNESMLSDSVNLQLEQTEKELFKNKIFQYLLT